VPVTVSNWCSTVNPSAQRRPEPVAPGGGDDPDPDGHEHVGQRRAGAVGAQQQVVSPVKVEKVVNAPRKPMASGTDTSGDQPRASATSSSRPSRKEPATLMPKVAHGKRSDPTERPMP
jgi:hypothetical protein